MGDMPDTRETELKEQELKMDGKANVLNDSSQASEQTSILPADSFQMRRNRSVGR